MAGVGTRTEHMLRPFRQASRTSRILVVAGAAITLLYVIVAFAGPAVYPTSGVDYRIEQDDGTFVQIPQLEPPSDEFPLGTTRQRFDVLARVIHGGRLALAVIFFATLLAMTIGVPLGLLSGYRGGRLDRLLVTVMDAVYVFPPLLLAIVVAFLLRAYLSPGVPSASVAVGVVYIPQYFRVVRNHTLSVKQEPYVEAAKSLGAKERTVIGRYVFFNVVQSVPVIFTINAADAVLTLASLGFLGYGVQPPTPEWGYDISQAIRDITAGVWWTALWPGLAVVTLVTGLTLLGEGLNDVVNPLLRARGAAGTRLDDAPAAVPADPGDGSSGDGKAHGERESPGERARDGTVAGAGQPGHGAVAGPARNGAALLARGLRVGYRTTRGPLWAVDGIDVAVQPGECLGLVGESGCGKSSLGRGLLQLLPPGAAVHGSVLLGGQDLVGMPRRRLRRIRGEELGLIFQEPMTRLDPLMSVRRHFVETIQAHRPGVSDDAARHMAVTALAQMGIPPTRIDDYPHEFSGGMRQRIMIALALVLEPRVIVADEPTTALDVIVESQILDILRRLRTHSGVGLVLITHNLGIVAETCDRVAVMYAGKIVEIGSVEQVFADPKHPYTQGLLASTISLETTELHSIGGYPPDLVDPPPGCRFAPRCPAAMPHCTDAVPEFAEPSPGQFAACYLYPGAYPHGMTPPAGIGQGSTGSGPHTGLGRR